MKAHYDIAIIGAGMVGASLAAALLPWAQQLSLNIALIEANPLDPVDASSYQPSYDARTTALAYGSQLIFEQLGVWPRLSERLSSIGKIHVSDRGHFGAARLCAEREQVPALGYVVENRWLGEVLLEHLQQHPQSEYLDWLCPGQVEALTPVQLDDEQGMALQLTIDGKAHHCSASLVVMADGGRSALREALGISYRRESYLQTALVTNVSVDRDHSQIAYERFTEQGPMALLPLNPHQGKARFGLVWTLPEQQIDDFLALEDEAFLQQLQHWFGYRAGRFVAVGERHSYPLQLTLADEQVRSGLAIVGNAAHALHPLAGQGFNLALRGVADLAQSLIKARQGGVPLGDLAMLQAYSQSRVRDQQQTIEFSDKTMKLFAKSNSFAVLARDVGLQLLDVCGPAKTVFARQAMGLASTQAQLVPGVIND